MRNLSMPAAIVCRHCSRPMPLPRAEHPHPERPSWPDVRRYFPFLCPECGHAYVYSVSDLVPKEPEEINRDEDGSPRKDRNVIRLTIPCWSKACSGMTIFQQRGYVQIDTLLPFDLNLAKLPGDRVEEYYNNELWMVAEKLINSGKCVAHGISYSSSCVNGTDTMGESIRIHNPGSISAELDKLWKFTLPPRVSTR